MGISINGPSGIDTNYIIDSLVEVERNKVRAVEAKKSAYQLKIDSYSKLQAHLMAIRSKANALSESTSFDLFSTSSTNDAIATISGGASAVDGSYDVGVFQTAQSEKMISSDNLITSQSTALTDFGITPGVISVDGVEITIDNDDTMQDMRMKINNATDPQGNKLGVTASVIMASENNYRLVLTSKDTGSTGIEYQDISGSTLQDLGIITTATGEKGTNWQVAGTTGGFESSFNALTAGETIHYTGTDHNGNSIEGRFIKDAGSTIDEFFRHVSSTFHGTVDVSSDANGDLVVTDKIAGTSHLSLTTVTVGATELATGLKTVGKEGQGVLSVGKNAYFSVENIQMESSSNEVSGFVSGVTLNLHKASADEIVNVSLERDAEAITGKVRELLTSYNELLQYSRKSTQMADPEDEKAKRGDLAGDMTVNSIVSQVRTIFRQQFDALGGAYTSGTMIGINTDAHTGEISLDEKKFSEAMQIGFDEVVRLFTTFGVSDTNGVTLGKNTEETMSGVYTIEEVDADHLRIAREGTADWYTSDTRSGDIVSFSDGPAKGLSLTAPQGAIGAGSASFTFSKGIAVQLQEKVDELTESHEGLISLRQDSLRKSIEYANDRIDRLEDRVEKYRLRLVKQFSDMEQVMNNLQSQSMQMMNSLGFYSGSSGK